MADLHKLTADHGDNPMNGITLVEFGLAWERVAQPGEGSSVGKAKGWWKNKQRDAKGETDPADMDAGALFFVDGKPVKYLGFGNDDPMKDEADPAQRASASTTGDSIRGEGDGDDETLKLDLVNLPQRFTRVMIVVGAFKPGSKMTAVKDLKATVYDSTGGTKAAVGIIEPSLLETHEMLAIADLKRAGASWTLKVNGSGFTPVKGEIRSLLLKAMNVLGA